MWGLGIGDWELGIGDWGLGLGIGPNPQSPIPNPHFSLIQSKNKSLFDLFIFLNFLLLENDFFYKIIK